MRAATILPALWATTVSSAAIYRRNTTNHLPVVDSTTLPNGNIIDWVPKESQGEVASPPPFPPFNDSTTPLVARKLQGPPGTVPIIRESNSTLPAKILPSGNSLANGTVERRAGFANVHWYASTGQQIDNTGGQAVYSRFKAFVESPADFSLLQTAVVRDNIPGRRSQTVEAGWINRPHGGVREPHLFSFYTTVGHTQYGHNIQAWNTDFQGWVQTDRTYYPGMVMPTSVVGGQQLELKIRYALHGGNWWLGVDDRWIGYYPGSLFSQGSRPGDTLASKSNRIMYYGEIFNSETHMTTTDMGSGHYANEGYGKSAYIRSMTYSDAQGGVHPYDGSRGVTVNDPRRYSLQPSWDSGGAWGSYFFLGGPGAGGVPGG